MTEGERNTAAPRNAGGRQWGVAGGTLAAAALFLIPSAFAGKSGVTLEYAPEVGSVSHYDIRVRAETAVDLPCQAAEDRVDTSNLSATHEVLAPDGDGVRVAVSLERPGIGERTFVMNFDRAAHLTAVEQVEGIPAEALGDLGLAEIFPAAIGAPPEGTLRPGQRWTINETVDLEDSLARQVEGTGQLLALGTIDGHDTATIRTTTTLPVDATRPATEAAPGRRLTGSQDSTTEAIYDLSDGGLRSSVSKTNASYRLQLVPPSGLAGPPCVGTLQVSLTSEISRQA